MAPTGADRKGAAARASVRGAVHGVGFREATVREARRLGALGWVRNEDDGSVRVHAEGPAEAVERLLAFLGRGPRAARVEAVEVEWVDAEGHEQFAVRGVSAGGFVVRERAGPGPRFRLELEVGGALRSWALPKAPSLDPAVKRLAIEDEDRRLAGAEREPGPEGGRAALWDHGSYEQGGRVSWPEALERGHAVFVLHGERLRGGFALQRTRPGPPPQWLLIKRRDAEARPRSESVPEGPGAAASDRRQPS